MSPSISKKEREDLRRTFERILREHGVIDRREAKALIKERVEDLSDEECKERREAAEEAADEAFALTVAEIRDVLPDEVWEEVRVHLADADIAPDDAAEEAVHKSGRRTPGASPSIGKPAPSHAPDKDVTKTKPSDLTLPNVYGHIGEEPKAKTVSKEGGDSVALQGFYANDRR